MNDPVSLEEDPVSLDEAELEAKAAATQQELLRLERQGRLVSVTTTVVVHVIILILLTLVIISFGPDEIPQIVAIAESELDSERIEKKDFARSVKKKPQPAQSASRVQPLAAAMASPISVPTIEDPVVNPIGIGTDFGRGFGVGKGDGDGGGGTSSFFGGTAKGNRVVFVVDFSGSMKQADLAGGTRLDRLKKELIKSITRLPKGLRFQVIYYSTAPWLGGESLYTAPTRFADNAAHRVPWSEATKEGITNAITHVRSAQPEGATLWGDPLKLAFAMRPAPAVVWLLSDGEAQDGEEVVEDLKKINPSNIPINTIGLELPGPAFTTLVNIARKTGGKYSIVHQGKLYSGPAALRFADDQFDLEKDF